MLTQFGSQNDELDEQMIDSPMRLLYTSSMKGFRVTIIFCSWLLLQGCASMEPLNAIPWLDQLDQTQLEQARTTIGLKHHKHYEEKRLLDAVRED